MTIALRPAQAADAPWLATWFSAAASAVGYPQVEVGDLFARAGSERGLHVRMIQREDALVGVVAYTITPTKPHRGMFELVATPRAHARKGAGMTAAALAEEEMRAAGVETVLAPATALNGISMYFWIRLGYAPLPHDEWPCRQEGIAWLQRNLSE